MPLSVSCESGCSPASSAGMAPASELIELGGGPKPSQPIVRMLAATMATNAVSIFFTFLSSAPTPVGAMNGYPRLSLRAESD
ncbi:MAG: hypothetical protein NUW08_02120 [Candidatus Uhrbacteria bacterium]|nr:hypothetical protein [Candidatus Uhrbacteria bacterium]